MGVSDVIVSWIDQFPAGIIRTDISSSFRAASFVAEGVQAFSTQAIALNFCALHSSTNISDRFQSYIAAWLIIPK